MDFAQLTDPQVVDEMSPARVDFADAAGGDIGASWRPQEALGTQVFDQVVRNVNANRTSRVRQGNGKRAKVGFAITTGDMADNQHLNESRWFKTVLDGGTVDPFSGDPITNQCGNVPADRLAKLNADVAARTYTGVADYDDYRDAPQDRFAGFWDPDEAAPDGRARTRRSRATPGLLEAAQRPFQAAGLDVPWYISRGNHDGLVQGNAPASEDLFRAIATGCLKVFPNAAFDPKRFEGASDDELFASFGDPAFIQQLLAGAKTVAPDTDRRILSKREYRSLIGHGFAYTPRSELRRSRGSASYYAFTRKGVRFISLDTVAEGGGQNGNIDDPQYRWLRGELRKAKRRDRLVVVFGHHPMRSMTNTRADERAGKCDPADEPGCDRDPRRSTPLHLADGQEVRAGAAGRHAERRRLRRRAHPREPRSPSTAAARGAASGRSRPPRTSTTRSRAARSRSWTTATARCRCSARSSTRRRRRPRRRPAARSASRRPARVARAARCRSTTRSATRTRTTRRARGAAPTATWSCS